MGETSVTSRLWQASIAVLFSVLAAGHRGIRPLAPGDWPWRTRWMGALHDALRCTHRDRRAGHTHAAPPCQYPISRDRWVGTWCHCTPARMRRWMVRSHGWAVFWGIA